MSSEAERVPGSLIQSPESLRILLVGGEWKLNVLPDPYGTSQVLFRQSVQSSRWFHLRIRFPWTYGGRLVRRMGNTLIVYPCSGAEFPTDLFESQELLEGDDGESLGARPVGTNAIGMVAWVVKMKTPEYPGVVRLS
jgi:hypothetical protein